MSPLIEVLQDPVMAGVVKILKPELLSMGRC